MKNFVLLSFLLLTVKTGFAREDIVIKNSSALLDVIEKKISSIESFAGTFIYRTGNITEWGEITYQAPDKLALIYLDANKQENGKKIIIDDKQLWIVNGNIAIREALKNVDNPTQVWNIKRLKNEYIPTKPSGGYNITYGRMKAFQLNFIAKTSIAGFRQISIICDVTGIIYQISATNQLGKVSTISLHYDEFNEEYEPDTFKFISNEETLMYENILLQ